MTVSSIVEALECMPASLTLLAFAVTGLNTYSFLRAVTATVEAYKLNRPLVPSMVTFVLFVFVNLVLSSSVLLLMAL